MLLKYPSVDALYTAVLNGDATFADLLNYIHDRESGAYSRGYEDAKKLYELLLETV